MSRPPAALRSALVVSGARVVSVILALATGILSARYFGTSVAKDCYVVAQAIPGLLTTLVFGGLSTSTLVTLIEIGTQEGTAGQFLFVRRLMRQLAVAVVPLYLVVILWPGIVIRPFAPGFNPEEMALVGRLLRLTLAAAILHLACMVVRSLFESRGAYATSHLLYLAFPAASLAVLALLGGRIGVYALAAGPLPGLLLALTALWAIAAATLRDPFPGGAAPGSPVEPRERMRRFWRVLGPMSLAANLGQFNLLIDNAFASSLPSGSITMMGFALSIIIQTELPTSLSLAEIAFWRLTSAAQRGAEDLGATLRTALRQMILLTAPLCGGAIVFGAPLSRVLFERGRFGPDATAGVARLLAFYGPEIVFSGYAVLLVRVLFARRRMRTVLSTSITAITSNIVLDALLMHWFGIYGIALATTLVALIYTLSLLAAVRREVSGIVMRDEALYAARVLGGAALMVAAVLVFRLSFERLFGTAGDVVRGAEVFAGLGIGGAVFIGVLRALGVPEAGALFRRILSTLVPSARP